MITVYFKDGTELTNIPWNSLPDKPILSLSYKIGDKLIELSGYEMYNHLVEKIAGFGKPPQTTKLFLMGRACGKTKIVTIDYRKKIITEKITDIGQEYNGQATTGWKNGVVSFIPSVSIR